MKDLIQNHQIGLWISPQGWVDKISFLPFWLFGAPRLITWWSACVVTEDPKYCLHYFTNTESPSFQPSPALPTAGGSCFAIDSHGTGNETFKNTTGTLQFPNQYKKLHFPAQFK